MGLMTTHGLPVVSGTVDGTALVSATPISLWGGLNPETGEVIDRRHPLSGQIVTGRVLVIPHGRGSCTASGVLLEAIRLGTAPAAIVLAQTDPIMGLGAILGEELYGKRMPLIVIDAETHAQIPDGATVTITEQGDVTVATAP